MLRIIIFLLLFFVVTVGYTQEKNDTLITQTITYQTKKAGQLYLVWDVDNWQLPGEKYWNEKSFLKKGMVWSKMEGEKDSFSISIKLPVNTQLDFMFWIPIDRNGDSTDGWDTYGSLTYNSKFTQNKSMLLKDGAMWLPEKKKHEFNVLEYGWHFFIAGILISFLLVFLFRRKLFFSSIYLIVGALIPAVLLISLIRMQMNGLVEGNKSHVFGAVFPDLVWFFSISAFFILVSLLIKKYNIVKTIIVALSLTIILLSVLFSLLNIEIIKFLGRPVNYQWLYYSDFMTGADAKTAFAQNLTPGLKLNLGLFLIAIMVFSFAFSFLPTRVKVRSNIILGCCAAVLFLFGFYQFEKIKYENGKIVNPAWEMISSTITSERSCKIFSLKVSKETETFIQNYHNQPIPGRYDTNSKIDNIILFVLESTPANMVSVYDSTYNVTSNIIHWKNISCAYTNMYAHLPATVYSMGSMLAGVYPLISYQSMIASYPKNRVPSLSSELKKEQWSSSMFFAADLAYSNMGMYARNQGFDVAEDNTTITCRFPKFGQTNTFLDQLDDRCLVESYLNWVDSSKAKKKFSVLWTTQTHYSYLFKSKEAEYDKNNKDLNKYLNALKEEDIAFGMLMEGLEKRNLLNNTLVILTADHGEAFGTHNQIIHATRIYEENVHIPFILYSPLLFKGQINNRISGLIDIPPTIYHVIGLPKPIEWEGKSLLANGIKEDRTFFICPFNDFIFGTRSGKWKYIYNGGTNEEELYDLSNDSHELKNIAAEHPDVAKKEFEMIAGWVQYHNRKMKQLLK